MDIFEKAERLKQLAATSRDREVPHEDREAAAAESVSIAIDAIADFFDDISRIANALEKRNDD
jgi:hypothetical protein